MYKLMVFLDVTDGFPGMLIPVFSTRATNLPFVQQMDAYFNVKDMLPFLEHENYPCVAHDAAREVNIGDRGLIAFRSTDGDVVCGDSQEIMDYIRKNADVKREGLIGNNPILTVQLNRIEGRDMAESYKTWRNVAKLLFPELKQQRQWVDSEALLLQKQKEFWDQVDVPAEDEVITRHAFPGNHTEFSFEYLLRWLSNRNNFISRDWTRVWHYLNAVSPFDQRLMDLALRWIYFMGAQDKDLQPLRSILYVILDRARADERAFADVGKFLSDKFIANVASLYDFLRPAQLFTNLLWMLARLGEPEDVLELISFCIYDFPQLDYVQKGLRSSLEILAARDVDEGTVLRIQELSKALASVSSASPELVAT